MSDSKPPPYGSSEPENPPNWGSAYPPPGEGYSPPGSGYPPQGYPPYQPYGPPLKHPSATTAMVLGIVAVAGGLICWLPLFISPFAWFTGSKAIRDIDESRGTQGGRGEALAGKVLGIIGTVLLALGIAFVILLVVLTITVPDFWDE